MAQAFQSWSVYEIVMLVTAPALVVAVVTSIHARTSFPLVVHAASLSGRAAGVIACAVVVVTTSHVFTQSTSRRYCVDAVVQVGT